MATVPLSGTFIRFLSGVPFSNDYKHTRYFETRDEQKSYFINKNRVHEMEQSSFQRQTHRTFVDVDASIDKLYGTNYMYFGNPDFSDRRFYAFVTELEYKNAGTTRAYFEIDVYQTWYLDTVFKPSFVVREHRPLWNSDGTPVVNTVDEGLDYGGEYDIMDVTQYQPSKNIQFLVIVCKTPMHESDDGNDVKPKTIGMPQPLTYYVTPFRQRTDLTPTIMNGDTAIVPTPPVRVMEELYKNEKAVNNIISMYITDDFGLTPSVDLSIPSAPAISFSGFDDYLKEVEIAGGISTLLVKKIMTFGTKKAPIMDDKYENYAAVKESKLLMYPYTTLVMDDFKGNRVGFKNEYIRTKGINILMKGSLGLSNFVSYGIDQYNHGDITDNQYFFDVNNDSALINNSPNDVSVINDYLTAFIQGNKNQLQNQHDTIMFNSIMNGISGGANALGGVVGGSPNAVVQGTAQVTTGIGNTVLELQGIEAKQKDIANVPPSIAKMGSNTAYNNGHNYTGVYLIKKQIKSEYRRKLTHFFNMFGYKTNEVKVPNMNTRRYWNYVQTKSCIIRGSLNNVDLNELKRVFDNGITLWHTDDIGNYSLDNEVVN